MNYFLRYTALANTGHKLAARGAFAISQGLFWCAVLQLCIDGKVGSTANVKMCSTEIVGPNSAKKESQQTKLFQSNLKHFSTDRLSTKLGSVKHKFALFDGLKTNFN